MNTFYVYKISLESLFEAKVVLRDANEIIDEYAAVSLADICKLAGIEAKYEDFHIRWIDLTDARIVHRDDEWILILPEIKG